MGKFNFMSGGYYGKLGQTVGQRFRNQRVVHAYVVPSNPRTETQQENRLRFVDITGAVQLANQLNGGSRLWDNLTNTNFNNRMAEASKYAEQGGVLYTYVPLIPYGYEPEHHFEPSPTYENHVLTWTCTDTAHLLGRQMAVALRLQRISNSRYENVILRAVVGGVAGAWTFSVTVPDTYRINSDSWQIGINCDDGQEQLEMVYLAPMSIANLKEKITLTLNSLSVTWDSINETYSGTISTSPAIATDAMPLLSASLSGILQGEASAQNTIIQTVNSAGALAFTFTPNRDSLNQRVLFPAGSTCTIPAATFQSDAYIYQVPATTLTFSAALETQTLVNAVEATLDYSAIYLNFLAPSGSTNWQEGNIRTWVLNSNIETESWIKQAVFSWEIDQNNDFWCTIPEDTAQFILGKNGKIALYVTTAPTCTFNNITYRLIGTGYQYIGQSYWASTERALYCKISNETPYLTLNARLGYSIDTVRLSNLTVNITDDSNGTLYYNSYNNSLTAKESTSWGVSDFSLTGNSTISIELIIFNEQWLNVLSTLSGFNITNASASVRVQLTDTLGNTYIDCVVPFNRIEGVV